MLADQTLRYDVADRHLSTTVVDGTGTTTIVYVRDATGRIVQGESTPAPTPEVPIPVTTTIRCRRCLKSRPVSLGGFK